MNEQTQQPTSQQLLEVIYNVSKTAKLSYEEHAVLQDYFNKVKAQLSKCGDCETCNK